ncbi:MAG: hypothetical protein AABX17_00905 [Nanoarchaeota archaeon]
MKLKHNLLKAAKIGLASGILISGLVIGGIYGDRILEQKRVIDFSTNPAFVAQTKISYNLPTDAVFVPTGLATNVDKKYALVAEGVYDCVALAIIDRTKNGKPGLYHISDRIKEKDISRWIRESFNEKNNLELFLMQGSRMKEWNSELRYFMHETNFKKALRAIRTEGLEKQTKYVINNEKLRNRVIINGKDDPNPKRIGTTGSMIILWNGRVYVPEEE